MILNFLEDSFGWIIVWIKYDDLKTAIKNKTKKCKQLIVMIGKIIRPKLSDIEVCCLIIVWIRHFFDKIRREKSILLQINAY